jgi:hypothetical protein
MDILCLDLETGGLDETMSGIVEIGAVWLDGSSSFYRACKPFPMSVIEDDALKVNGCTREQLADPNRLPEALAIVELLGWVRGSIPRTEKVQICAWNPHFDFRHLCRALDRASVGRHSVFAHRLLDMHSLTAGHKIHGEIAGTNMSEFLFLKSQSANEISNCDEGSKYWGLLPEPKPHSALVGAGQVRAMLRRFLGDAGALNCQLR